jgi:hypothetical protein
MASYYTNPMETKSKDGSTEGFVEVMRNQPGHSCFGFEGYQGSKVYIHVSPMPCLESNCVKAVIDMTGKASFPR